MSVTLEKLVFALQEYWSLKKGGGPVEQWRRTGPAWQMLRKGFSAQFKGKAQAKIPVSVNLSTGTGANFQRSILAASLYGQALGEQFLVDGGEHWSHLSVEGEVIDYATPESVVGDISGVMVDANRTSSTWHQDASSMMWLDGSGRMGKGDGAYSVAGDTITFLNEASTQQFNRGDLVCLIDPATPLDANGIAQPRTLGGLTGEGYRVVIARGRNTIQLDGNVDTITGATNADWVSKWAWFAGKRIFHGFPAWVPFTETESLTTRFGVDRSVLPLELSGRRVHLDGNETTYQIVALVLKEYTNAAGSAPADAELCLFTSSGEIEALMSECRAQNVGITAITTKRDAQTMRMGVSAFEAVFPTLSGKAIKIVVDPFLHDPGLATDADRTHVLLDMANFRFETAKSGISWKKYAGGANMLTQRDAQDEYYASYGARGALMCHATAFNVVASTRANT